MHMRLCMRLYMRLCMRLLLLLPGPFKAVVKRVGQPEEN